MSSSNTELLVVDDEEFNREIIADYLEDSRYTLTMAENGLEAWGILEANPIQTSSAPSFSIE